MAAGVSRGEGEEKARAEPEENQYVCSSPELATGLGRVSGTRTHLEAHRIRAPHFVRGKLWSRENPALGETGVGWSREGTLALRPQGPLLLTQHWLWLLGYRTHRVKDVVDSLIFLSCWFLRA